MCAHSVLCALSQGPWSSKLYVYDFAAFDLLSLWVRNLVNVFRVREEQAPIQQQQVELLAIDLGSGFTFVIVLLSCT